MSLYARLALWLGASLALLVLLHGIVTERAPRLTTEDYIATRLEHDAEWLVDALRIENGRLSLDEHLIPPIYQRPGSGHYFTLLDAHGATPSASSLGRTLPLPGASGLSHARMPRADDQPAPRPTHHNSALAFPTAQGLEPLLILRRDLPQGGILLLAESLDDLDAHLNSFRLRFVALSLGLFLLLLAGQFLLLRWLLRPVRQLEKDTERLERGELLQLPEPVLNELRPLAGALNRLLERQARRLERSRNALADLAHALKTPIAALRQSLGTPLSPPAAGALERIEEIIQRELRHARWSHGEAVGLAPLDVVPALHALLQTMRLIHRDRGVNFVMNAPEHLMLRMDREDLLELFGNLLDNAGKWAHSQVRLTVQPTHHDLTALIEDDGPGTDTERLNHDATRGQRLDESRPGHGLGLAIVRQIVAAHDGRLHFDRSRDLGGLCVALHLPGRALTPSGTHTTPPPAGSRSA
ncbi:MAG: sensor histidine kinase [Pseudomonadota bacterium]